MRWFVRVGFVVAVVGLACQSQSSPTLKPLPKSSGPEPSFKVGDLAPPLKVTKWFNGPETKIEPGYITILDFWATWCGPCLQTMPHVAELLSEYANDKVRVIAVTHIDDRGNDLKSVEKFVANVGNRFPFPFAYCNDTVTALDYLGAAQVRGIPSSFVIDREGKLAFIGHPMELEGVLARIVAGKWNPQTGPSEIELEEAELKALSERIPNAAAQAERIYPGRDPEGLRKAVRDAAAKTAKDVIAELPAFEQRFPFATKTTQFRGVKLAVLMQAGEFTQAKTLAEPLLAQAIERKNSTLLNMIRQCWTSKGTNPQAHDIALAVKALEAMLALESSPRLDTALQACETYYAAGNLEKGDEFAERAKRLAASNPKLVPQVEAALKSFKK